MDSAQKKFTDLKAQNDWKPSDKSPDEHLVSLLAQFKRNSGANSGNANSQDNSGQKGKRESPPFAKHSGTEGQTKKWKGKTYYYCPKKHSNGAHWVCHKPEDHDKIGEKIRKYKEKCKQKEKEKQANDNDKNNNNNSNNNNDKGKKVVVNDTLLPILGSCLKMLMATS